MGRNYVSEERQILVELCFLGSLKQKQQWNVENTTLNVYTRVSTVSALESALGHGSRENLE